jgi:transposase InsO family protein
MKRFEQGGAASLFDASRAPSRIPHRTRDELVALIVSARQKHPTWGPKKLKKILEEEHLISLPALSTIAAILKRSGLVEVRRYRPSAIVPRAMKLRTPTAPNEVWCGDYKGQFRMGNGRYCYPLTVTDQFSRFLFACEGMSAISDEAARECMLTVFAEHGLPVAIRSDNGVPFASRGLASLTRLSALWLRLGIELERIDPGHPEQNGRHERMHRTLKRETARPAAANELAQQERFDAFIHEYNCERPHEALEMKTPSAVHTPSPRRLPAKLPVPTYPLHDDVLRLDGRGHVRILRRDVYVASALAHEELGMREEEDGRMLLTFMQLDLGHLAEDASTFTPIEFSRK